MQRAPNSFVSVTKRAIQWRKSLQLIAQLSQRGLRPSVFILNSVLAALKDAEKGALAYDVLLTFPQIRVQPDVVSYNTVTSALERCSLWQTAIANIGDLVTANLWPNVISLNALLSALGRGSNWRGALLAFRDARSPHFPSNNLQLRELFRIFQLAKVRPDGTSYGAAMKACVASMHWNEALSLLPASNHFGSKISERTALTIALTGCSLASRWLQGLILLEARAAGSGDFDSALVGAMVNACASGQAWELALALWTKHKGLSNEVVLRSLIAACELGSWQTAMLLLRTYRNKYYKFYSRNRNKFSSIASVAAMASAAKATQWQLAIELFQERLVRHSSWFKSGWSDNTNKTFFPQFDPN